MSQQREEQIRHQLLTLREAFLGEVRSKNQEAATLIDEGVADFGDQSLMDQLSDVLHLLSDSKREEILKIDAALERLRTGSYGTCQQCGALIDLQRLEIRPFTRFCVACKAAEEEQARRQEAPGKGTL